MSVDYISIDYNAKHKQDGAEMYSGSDVRIHL